jgi:hypothetical protein
MLRKRALHFERILALQNPDAAKETGEPSSDSDYSLSEGVKPRRVSSEAFLGRFNKIQELQKQGKTQWRHGEI